MFYFSKETNEERIKRIKQNIEKAGTGEQGVMITEEDLKFLLKHAYYHIVSEQESYQTPNAKGDSLKNSLNQKEQKQNANNQKTNTNTTDKKENKDNTMFKYTDDKDNPTPDIPEPKSVNQDKNHPDFGKVEDEPI